MPKHKKKITITQYFDNYTNNYKQKDLRTIEGALNKFQEYLQKPKLAISSLNSLHIEKFKHYLVNEAGLNGETPYSYWRRFKKVLIHAEKESYIKESVYKNIRWESKNKKAESTLTKQVITEICNFIAFSGQSPRPKLLESRNKIVILLKLPTKQLIHFFKTFKT